MTTNGTVTVNGNERKARKWDDGSVEWKSPVNATWFSATDEVAATFVPKGKK